MLHRQDGEMTLLWCLFELEWIIGPSCTQAISKFGRYLIFASSTVKRLQNMSLQPSNGEIQTTAQEAVVVISTQT